MVMHAPSPHARVFRSILPPLAIPPPPVPWEQLRARRGLLARLANIIRRWLQ